MEDRWEDGLIQSHSKQDADGVAFKSQKASARLRASAIPQKPSEDMDVHDLKPCAQVVAAHKICDVDVRRNPSCSKPLTR